MILLPLAYYASSKRLYIPEQVVLIPVLFLYLVLGCVLYKQEILMGNIFIGISDGHFHI